MNYKNVLFIGILILAAILRFSALGLNPPSLDWDEASLGYNAYSILNTGKDEYGEWLPLSIKSFGDYKPALYLYFIIPFIPLLGLSDVAVRLPSALFGITAVLLTYFLCKELLRYGSNHIKKNQLFNEALPLLVSFLLAISPWHIQFSRVAFEASTALTFNLAGIVFFFVGLRKQTFFPLSVLFLGLGVYIYQSERVFIPLLVLVLLAIFGKTLLTTLSKKIILVTMLVGFLTILPFALSIITDANTLSRARGVSVLSREYPQTIQGFQYTAENKQNNEYVGLIFNNARVEYAKIIVGNYLSHFDPKWMFLTGDSIPRHHASNTGNLYIWELPFILLGIYGVCFIVFSKKIKIFLFAWLFITPIPASIAWDVPSSVRTLNFLPLFQIFTAIGILGVGRYLYRKVTWKPTLVVTSYAAGIVGILLVFFGYYLLQYFVYYAKETSQEWQYGYEPVVEYLQTHGNEYDQIIVSNQSPLDQSYIFFLYHQQYSPSEYQKISTNETTGEKQFKNYVFKPLQYDTERGNVLYVGRPQDFPDSVSPVHTIKYLNGEDAILLVE